ncbi:MAG: LysR family transcriptional regulator [Myxococcales bacterium]|nr:LysR family transcriptional regulator [Myxococcales bacterium]
MHLSSVDLNLLVALDALLQEQSVSGAAKRLRLSQSATSHALGRLRELFGDALLVRGYRSMVPTERACAIKAPLRAHLDGIRELFEDETASFDPRTLERTFVIASEDYFSATLLPPLYEALQRKAPRLRLEVWGYDEGEPKALSTTIDLTAGVRPFQEANLHTEVLFDDRMVCVVRDKHPSSGNALALETFVSLPHVLVGLGQPGRTHVDALLAERGINRRVTLRVHHFLAAPLAVAASDAVLTLPERLARRLVTFGDFRVMEPPIDIPSFTYRMAWHERCHNDPGHRWLRRLLAKVATLMD